MDRIVIDGLEVWGRHGVLGHERALGQRFILDVTLELDLRPAATRDDLGRTVDYGELSQKIHDHVAGEPHHLIETVAEDVAALCLQHDRVRAVEVVVHKPDAPLTVPAREVRVEIRRERS